MSASLESNSFDKIRPFVTSTTKPVYCLRNLPEEVVAVLFAYYSRSRETLRENLLKLLQEEDLALGPAAEDDEAALAEAREKARAFHEKWVVGYGHSSVAEHAIVHVAVEDISILASKVVEDARLASFTEKSTRYVPFDTTRYHTPGVFAGTKAGREFEKGIKAVMSAYSELMDPLVKQFAATRPMKEGQTERGHMAACRAQACDVLRYLLPAATHTNIGMTINARALEALLVKMLSHPLEEVREYGRAIKLEALRIVPTLIKYADASDYRAETARRVEAFSREIFGGRRSAGRAMHPFPADAISSDDTPRRVRLVRYDADAENRVLEAILYPASGCSAGDVFETVAELPLETRGRIVESYLAGRGRYDAPLRALEETRYTFEITTDYGAYRDIQRHRMAGQYPQPLTVDLGFETPPELGEAGMTARFENAMRVAAECCRTLSTEYPEEAQYVVPLAYRKRFLMSMDLRELHHFVQLRSARQGHASYRRVAQEVYQEVARVHPALATFIRVDLGDYALSRA